MPPVSQQLRLRDRAATVLEASGLGAVVRRVGAWRGLLVLNYHQVANRESDVIDPSLWSATQDQLDETLRFLRRHLEVVGPEALPDGPGGRARVMLTFDDGYRDNHDLRAARPARPWGAGDLLRRLRLHRRAGDAVVGRAGGAAGGERASGAASGAVARRRDRARRLPCGARDIARGYEATPPDGKQRFLDEAADALGVARARDGGAEVWMTWDHVRALRDAGMAIGGHTAGHPRLADLPAAEQSREVRSGLDRLESELGARPSLFSYPYGDRDAFDADTVAALREAGIRFAFSYYGGYNSTDCWDPYDLRRVSATATATKSRRRAMVTLPRLFARW